jgi:hypothetical protein
MPQIFLAGVRGPSHPTIARGNITSLLKHLELAEKAQETEMTTSHGDRTRPPSVTFFGTFVLRSFSFVCLFQLSVLCLSFYFRFSFVESFAVSFQSYCASHSGRLEQHALAPKFRAEVASRLWAL